MNPEEPNNTGGVTPEAPVNKPAQPQPVQASTPTPAVNNQPVEKKSNTGAMVAAVGASCLVLLLIFGISVYYLINNAGKSIKKAMKNNSASTSGGTTYAIAKNTLTQEENTIQIKKAIDDYFSAAKAQDSETAIKYISKKDNLTATYLKDFYTRSQEKYSSYQIATTTWPSYEVAQEYSEYPTANTAVVNLHITRTNSYAGSQDSDISLEMLYDGKWKMVTTKSLVPYKLVDLNLAKTTTEGNASFTLGIKQAAFFDQKIKLAESITISGVAFPHGFSRNNPTIQDDLGTTYTFDGTNAVINGYSVTNSLHYETFSTQSKASRTAKSLNYSYPLSSVNLPSLGTKSYGSQVLTISL